MLVMFTREMVVNGVIPRKTASVLVEGLVGPPRTLHAEGGVRDRVVCIVAIPEALPFGAFLKFMPPKKLWIRSRFRLVESELSKYILPNHIYLS